MNLEEARDRFKYAPTDLIGEESIVVLETMGVIICHSSLGPLFRELGFTHIGDQSSREAFAKRMAELHPSHPQAEPEHWKQPLIFEEPAGIFRDEMDRWLWARRFGCRLF